MCIVLGEIIYVDFTSQASKNNYERPWQSQVPPLEQSVEIVEKYPSDEEENGMVAVAWRGPLAKVIAIKLLWLNCFQVPTPLC